MVQPQQTIDARQKSHYRLKKMLVWKQSRRTKSGEYGGVELDYTYQHLILPGNIFFLKMDQWWSNAECIKWFNFNISISNSNVRIILQLCRFLNTFLTAQS